MFCAHLISYTCYPNTISVSVPVPVPVRPVCGGFAASSRRQAHGLRQHAAAAGDDVRLAWRGCCSPPNPRPGPGQRWTPFYFVKFVFIPLWVCRGGGGLARGSAPWTKKKEVERLRLGHYPGILERGLPWGRVGPETGPPPLLHGPSPH